MSIKTNFGIVDGKEVYLFTIKNSKGMVAQVSNYGGTLVSLKVQGKNGTFDDVVLGYDKLEDYRKYNYFFGATIGRVANRIGTASFEINGNKYNLAKNEGENHIHGGVVGFDKKVWEEKIGSKDKIGRAHV